MNIIIPSSRPSLALKVVESLKPYECEIFDGNGYVSFSKLINDCILHADHELVIIVNDKARPKPSDIDRMVNLLGDGYGLVCMYRFGFFGFRKDLIRKVGFFDERYLGGGFEDCDYVRRLKEMDISYYESEEIEYEILPSTWSYQEDDSLSKNHFLNKWVKCDNNIISRELSEEDYGYELGDYKGTIFLPFDTSMLLPINGDAWKDTKIKSK